ncbi:MAG: DUF4974 domain-containing protein [Labilibaculum sp.]|nr:FecR family protein [Labilibaculum sp.]MBI9057338.1 DUF4974 domain-containing protein [Labilibaculum sp.]
MKEFNQIINKELTAEEELLLLKNLESDFEKRDEFIRLKNLWNLSKIKDEQLSLPRKKQMFDNFWHARKESISHLSLVRWVWRYAAVFIFVLFTTATSYLLINNHIKNNSVREYSFNSEARSISSFTLTDGSLIWLNAQSNVQIREEKNKVLVKLNGEALFEVVHNEKREFIVDLGNIKVHDLGTKFNIKAYEKDNIIKTTLIEGDVDVLRYDGSCLANLDPGEAIFYNKTKGNAIIKKVDSKLVASWSEGKFVFIDMALGSIIQDIEKWYHVDIQIKDKELANTKFTSVIQRHTTIKQVLDILKSALDINYKIETKTRGKDVIIIY